MHFFGRLTFFHEGEGRGSGVEGAECRGWSVEEKKQQLPFSASCSVSLAFYSTLNTRHFFLIVPIEAVKIPMISSRRVIRC